MKIDYMSTDDENLDVIEFKKDYKKFLALREKINSQIDHINENADSKTINKVKKIKKELSKLNENEKKKKSIKESKSLISIINF